MLANCKMDTEENGDEKYKQIDKNKECNEENSCNNKTMTVVEENGCNAKIKKILNNVTIEPVLVCYVMPSILMYLVVQNLHLDKACRVNLQYGEELCDRIIKQDVANLTAEVQNIQKLVAQMQVWKVPLQTTLPAILIVFVGSWSDRTGRRKPGIMVPMLGDFITCIGLILSVYYFMECSLEITAFIEAIPPALCGGFAILTSSAFSYVTDITTHENRTFRFGLVNIIAVIAMPAGQALSGVLIKYVGYYGVLCIIGSFFAIGFVYAWILIKEYNIKKTKVNTCGLLNFFNARYVAETFMVVLKPRDRNNRTKLIVLVSMIVLVNGPMYGELSVMYLFSRYKFNFTEIEYSIYGTYSSIVHILGTIIAIGILNRRFNVNDYWLGILAGSSKIAASFVFAFAPSVSWYYMGPLVECFSGFNGVIVRTLASKFVEQNETGRLYSIIGLLEALTPTFYSPLYNKVYLHTLDYFPGAFFFLGALSALPSVVTYSIMNVSHRKELLRKTSSEAVTGDRYTPKKEEQNGKEMYAYDNEASVI